MEAEVRVINNHLVYPVMNIEQQRAIFPDLRYAQAQDGNLWGAVPFTLDYAVTLRNMGYSPPSPITTVYDWPGRYKPYKHQIVTAEFFTLNRRSFCLNGMGTGKTMSALWAADYLMKLGKVKRVLILSPLSTLERVWGDEIFCNFPYRRMAVLHGTRAKRLELLAKPHDFYIINHDGFEIIKDSLKDRPDIGLVIIDELATYRNSQTKRWRSLNSYFRSRPDILLWGLTGTPTPNAPTDAYAQSRLIAPENFKGHFTQFKNLTMQQFGPFKWVARRGCEKLVSDVLRPSLRYALRDCIDLPETIYHNRDAELSPQQHHHYEKIRREASTQINGMNVTAVNAANLISKLVQAACGVVYGNRDGELAELDFGPRLRVLEEAIEESEAKVIVFVPFTGVLDALARELSRHWNVAIVDGSVSKARRNVIFQDFQQSTNPHIIVAHPQTMAHGLNLTRATTIIWYAPVYSNDHYEQANGRIVRPGQGNVTNIVHIAATSAERKIYAVLRDRGRLQGIVLDLVKGDMR